mgnify:CR=1 FL=1
MLKLFYIDPQSYNNLADYDRYLLTNIDTEKYFFCSEKFNFEISGNTKIDKCFFYNSLSGFKKVISYVKSVIYILKNVKKHKPDIIHFQWLKIPQFDYFILRKIKKVSKKTKIILTAHNILPHNTGNKYKKNYGQIYSFIDGVIVHGNNTKDNLLQMFPINKDKVVVIPHGFLPRVKKEIPAKVNDDFITFSIIGSLSKYKGVDLLVEAWCSSEYLLESKNCKLIIAGAGKMDCLEKIPSDKNIELINRFLSDEELDIVINQTDISILPYRVISQSGVLLTMLAERKPVIVSNVGDIVQPFEIAKCGWILDNIEVDIIKNLLESIIKDKSEYTKIKKDTKMWEDIGKFYSWDDIGKKTKTFYTKVIE